MTSTLAAMPKYESYKNSGFESYGDVPKHWDIKKLKHSLKIKNGQDHNDVVSVDGIYPVYGSGGEFARATEFLYEGEAILMGRKGTIDKPLHVNCAFWTVDTMFYGIPNGKYNTRFIYFLVTQIPFSYYSTSTALPSMTQSDLNNNPIVLPPVNEQNKIVKFLDEKTAQIDEAIDIKEKQIALFKERKKIVIQKAVTQGLNPDASMKDSGVDWVGKVPENWKVESFKNILVERNKKNNPIESRERLSLSIDKGVTLYSEKTTNLDRFKDDFAQYKLTHKGDLVFNSMNMIVGAVGVSNYFGCVSPVYYTYYTRLKNPKITKYYEYFFKSRIVQSQLYCLGKGLMAIDRGEGKFNTVRLKVSRDDLRSMKVPYPTISEITEIVDFIEFESSKISKAIRLQEQQIEKLKEYKVALINNAVTGKIKVI